MNYWKGVMNWPIDTNWKCVICGNTPIGIDGIGLIDSGLTWGMIHAQCRCNRCHAQYKMRDSNGDVVTNPISLLKDEYLEPAIIGWGEFKEPLDEWTDSMWDNAIAKAKGE